MDGESEQGVLRILENWGEKIRRCLIFELFGKSWMFIQKVQWDNESSVRSWLMSLEVECRSPAVVQIPGRGINPTVEIQASMQ